jgi:hypothetical protein
MAAFVACNSWSREGVVTLHMAKPQSGESIRSLPPVFASAAKQSSHAWQGIATQLKLLAMTDKASSSQ